MLVEPSATPTDRTNDNRIPRVRMNSLNTLTIRTVTVDKLLDRVFARLFRLFPLFPFLSACLSNSGTKRRADPLWRIPCT